MKFTHLPDMALAGVRRVLDDDADFRERVRSQVALGDVGTAGWLYLTRPPGWEDELRGLAQLAERVRQAEAAERQERTAVRRLASADEARAESERTAAELRRELAEARTRLTEERKARRTTESDAGRWRTGVAALERELAAARAKARPDAAPSVGPEDRSAALDAALAGLAAERGRVEALEERCRTAEAQLAARPPPPPPTVGAADVDATEALAAVARAVGGLAEAVATAASQLAPFLPAPPPVAEWPVPPGPPAAAPRLSPPVYDREPTPLPPGLSDDTSEAAEYLVRRGGVLVLVDGYNVTLLGRPELALPDQRRWLTDGAAALAARSGADIEIVFDGVDDDGGPPLEPPRRTKVRVRWSKSGVEADDVILERVGEIPPSRPLVVVSNDRRVRSGARRRGANVVSSDVFLGLLVQRPA